VAFDYPVMLDLTNVPVLVVGGGRVATRKVEGLLAAGAAVTVVAPDVDDEMAALPVRVVVRRFEPADLDTVRLVVTATDDAAVNANVATEASARGIWANSADDPANCTFILPAVARDGAVTIAVSTGGASPALASHLRAEAQRWLADIGAADAAVTLASQRAALRAGGVSTESIDWSDRVESALRPQP
jgi:precorrin-2 dehydrogenase / sirohydrochlorin ferrochelatase